jgi:hypothetical protein
MSIRRLSQLQWFGLLAGGTTWFAEFLAGILASQARCNPGSAGWGFPHDAIQLGLMLFGAVVVGAAGVASAIVFRATYEVEEQDPPPHGRIHFFAAAACAGNIVFFVIILLTGIATIVDRTCHQA